MTVRRARYATRELRSWREALAPTNGRIDANRTGPPRRSVLCAGLRGVVTDHHRFAVTLSGGWRRPVRFED